MHGADAVGRLEPLSQRIPKRANHRVTEGTEKAQRTEQSEEEEYSSVLFVFSVLALCPL